MRCERELERTRRLPGLRQASISIAGTLLRVGKP
jgi:hypothetical protein